MNPFNRLPGSRRARTGVEWTVLKKLPAVLLGLMVACAGVLVLLQSGWLDLSEKGALQAQFTTLGMLLFFGIIILTIALVCTIVVVMKGHAYVMDAYQLPDRADSDDSPAPRSSAHADATKN